MISSAGGVDRSSSPSQNCSNRSPRIYTASAVRAGGPARNCLNTSSCRGRRGHKCRSESIRTGHGGPGHRAYNKTAVSIRITSLRHVLITVAVGRWHFLDSLHHLHTANHLAEDTIAPAIIGLVAVIQEGIVGGVDEELRRGRMRVAGTCHGNGAKQVAEAAVRPRSRPVHWWARCSYPHQGHHPGS